MFKLVSNYSPWYKVFKYYDSDVLTLIVPFSSNNWKVKLVFIINELVNIFVYGPAEGRLRVREFLAALKTCWWPSAAICSVVGLLSFWHIPNFHSQFCSIPHKKLTKLLNLSTFNCWQTPQKNKKKINW